jgi:hypothetical protein
MTIGRRTIIYEPRFTCIDETRPWAVIIGDDVQITRGVTILTHGYDWSVLKGKYGTVLGSFGRVKIGNNVFIGMNTTILKGVNIGNNVVIGACSLVNKDIPDDCVAVGNPAKVIMTIEEFYKKRLNVQLEEAVNLALLYKNKFGVWPDESKLSEFLGLYVGGRNLDYSSLSISYKNKMRLVGNEEFSIVKLGENEPMFVDYEHFIKYCEGKIHFY